MGLTNTTALVMTQLLLAEKHLTEIQYISQKKRSQWWVQCGGVVLAWCDVTAAEYVAPMRCCHVIVASPERSGQLY